MPSHVIGIEEGITAIRPRVNAEYFYCHYSLRTAGFRRQVSRHAKGM
jgi:hypothetical protein